MDDIQPKRAYKARAYNEKSVQLYDNQGCRQFLAVVGSIQKNIVKIIYKKKLKRKRK